MRTFILIALCSIATSSTSAQTTEPIISEDYLQLIKKQDSLKQQIDSANDASNLKRSKFRITRGSYFNSVAKVITKGNSIEVKPVHTTILEIAGNYSSTVEIKRRNKVPALQNSFAQGRSDNGALKWFGPETNELYSYGPLISNLEYDGSNYDYDINGRLVAKGSGNGVPANTYENDVFRKASLLSQSVSVKGSLWKNYINVAGLSLKAGHTSENTIIKENWNRANNINVNGHWFLKQFTFKAAYQYTDKTFSNGNRNGFLNRLYQMSLLTPPTFSNQQGYIHPGKQRSYSSLADNPDFLLSTSNNSFDQRQDNYNLNIERKIGIATLQLSQSFEKFNQNSIERYAPGTAVLSHAFTNRFQNHSVYNLQANATFKFRSNRSVDHGALISYLLTDAHSGIFYTNYNNYQYQRSSNELTLQYSGDLRKTKISAGLKGGNKFYISNTTANSFWLPHVNGYIHFHNIFEKSELRISSSFNRFNTEPDITRSYTAANLLALRADQFLQYFPVKEVANFDALNPLKQSEFNARAELTYRYNLVLAAEFFIRSVKNDVFAIPQASAIQLMNLADHRNTGYEVSLQFNTQHHRHSNYRSMLSFYKYNSKVVNVANGFNGTGIAGFYDVHKAVFEGEPLGVIVGSKFLRDAGNNVVMGADGFPKQDISASHIVGNPVPDFSIKSNHRFEHKQWNFNIDFEWKKGGDIWNGTQAVLDYYGRSKTSGDLRGTTNYVFAGVLENGARNTIPVSFYNAGHPVANNRWVRYGYAGVTEAYIEKADHLRINNVSASYAFKPKKYLTRITCTLYAANIILWQAYSGADANQLFLDDPGSAGLDFFNLPSAATYGFNLSLQF